MENETYRHFNGFWVKVPAPASIADLIEILDF